MEHLSKSVLILGAGGHGEEVCSYLYDLNLVDKNQPTLLGCLDDGVPVGDWMGSRVLGGFSEIEKLTKNQAPNPLFYITALGDNALRKKTVEEIESCSLENLKPWTLQHPATQVGYEVKIGEGSLLAPSVILTTRIRIGRHCILNLKASVSHDCSIGDFVNINPAATLCGNVTVGEGTFIGAGAVVKEKITIGKNATIGAGAVIIRDVPDEATAVGVPGRLI